MKTEHKIITYFRFATLNGVITWTPYVSAGDACLAPPRFSCARPSRRERGPRRISRE